MTRPIYTMLGPGPFRADQIRPGDPYELSDGHAILCTPVGERSGASKMVGGIALAGDPGLEEIGAELGVEVGYSPRPGMLRAPDLSVTPGTRKPGWVEGVPPLAIEYADRGQDERELQQKIAELLEAGTRWIWVVRVDGRRRVEVHHADGTVELVFEGRLLEAPGVLKRAVPMEAMFDRPVALRHALENQLDRFGYRSLDEVREEGREQGREVGREQGHEQGLRQALFAVLERRGLLLTAEQEARIRETREPDQLLSWLQRSVDAERVASILVER